MARVVSRTAAGLVARPLLRLDDDISGPSKRRIEDDLLWNRRKQVRRYRERPVVVVKILFAKLHCRGLPRCPVLRRTCCVVIGYVHILLPGFMGQQGQRSQILWKRTYRRQRVPARTPSLAVGLAP